MMSSLISFLGFIGRGICHQKDSLSFFSDGIYMPLCSRCTGIYTGFVLSCIFVFLIERKIKGSVPTLKYLLFTVSAFLLMGIDVALTGYSILEPNNYIRFITGFIAGWTLSLVLIPLFNISIFKKLIKTSYLEKKWKMIYWFLAAAISAAAFLSTKEIIPIFWAALSVLGVISFYSTVITILIFSAFKKISNKVEGKWHLCLVLVSGYTVSIALISVISFLRGTFF